MTRMTGVFGAIVAIVSSMPPPAAAQTTAGLTPGRVVVFGDIGFLGDIGGGLNSSGIGLLSGGAAEMDANSWAERYDAGFLLRFGAGYNFNEVSQFIVTMHWDQAEADLATVGLLNQQPLDAKFSDYQGWGIDGGYRRYRPTTSHIKPFAQAAIGFKRVQEISADIVGQPSFVANEVPFYAESWVILWRFGGGFLTSFTDRVGLQVTADLQYTGVLNDRSGLGALGFERINDAGNKWSVPITGGLYFKF